MDDKVLLQFLKDYKDLIYNVTRGYTDEQIRYWKTLKEYINKLELKIAGDF